MTYEAPIEFDGARRMANLHRKSPEHIPSGLATELLKVLARFDELRSTVAQMEIDNTQQRDALHRVISLGGPVQFMVEVRKAARLR